jgi:diguanylate cyclase (GGDEF)-like protein
MRPFSQILQEANEELTAMNLSNEMLVMELKQAKERAEKLAWELRDANKALRELSFRDNLTGLYNHRSFQEMMDKEVSRAQRYERPLSLVLVDIDNFKRVNDIYGHPVGDQVLRAIGSKLESTTRKSGAVARYGGDEFALIVPETDMNGATILAERCRLAIEQMTIQVGNQTIRTTVSFGVSSYSHGLPGMSKAWMLDAADKALYQSKRAGRNKVTAMKLPE